MVRLVAHTRFSMVRLVGLCRRGISANTQKYRPSSVERAGGIPPAGSTEGDVTLFRERGGKCQNALLRVPPRSLDGAFWHLPPCSRQRVTSPSVEPAGGIPPALSTEFCPIFQYMLKFVIVLLTFKNPRVSTRRNAENTHTQTRARHLNDGGVPSTVGDVTDRREGGSPRQW